MQVLLPAIVVLMSTVAMVAAQGLTFRHLLLTEYQTL
jgi:hypothetical protein